MGYLQSAEKGFHVKLQEVLSGRILLGRVQKAHLELKLLQQLQRKGEKEGERRKTQIHKLLRLSAQFLAADDNPVTAAAAKPDYRQQRSKIRKRGAPVD